MSIFGTFNVTTRETIATNTTNVKADFAVTPRETLGGTGSGTSAPARFNLTVRETLGQVFSSNLLQFAATVRETLIPGITPVGNVPAQTLPIFPILPYGIKVRATPTLFTTVSTLSSLREIRNATRLAASWEFELEFQELRDATQNQTVYTPLAAYTQFEQLCQTWLMMYGQAGVFLFDASWDNSRSNAPIGTGDGTTNVFTVYRSFGIGTAQLSEPVGAVNTIYSLYINGVLQAANSYNISRNSIAFINPATGGAAPPAIGATITASFSFYYLCRFMSDEQDFEEFMKNRWSVNSFKFTSVLWV